VIHVESLNKTYVTSSGRIEALMNINFRVRKGEILGILGPNGAGKSTLIKILSTVLNSDSGKVVIEGCSIKDIADYKRKFTVAMQNSSLELWLSVEENLEIYGRFFGLKRSALSDRIDGVIKLFGLSDKRKKRASELSGGYRKRLQLARSFLVDTPVMMLDEPTAGLDPIAKNQVIELLKVKALEGRAIIFTTQIIYEAEVLCDKLLILNNGSEVANGSVKDVRSMFDMKNRIEFKFDKLTDLIFDEASLICKLNKHEIPDRCDNSIVFNLSMKNRGEKSTLIQLFEKLNPISINTKEPSLEEIFIELVKVGTN